MSFSNLHIKAILSPVLIILYLMIQGALEGSLIGAITYSGLSLPAWVAILGLLTCFYRHYSSNVALIATCIWIFWDVSPLSQSAQILFDLNNQQWSTILLIIIGIITLLFLVSFKQKTLFRLVMLPFLIAQLLAISLFHYVSINIPYQYDLKVSLNDARYFTLLSNTQAKEYCQVKELLCINGKAKYIAKEIENITNNYTIEKTFNSASSNKDFFYSWPEITVPNEEQNGDSLRYITLFKKSNDWLLIIDENRPSKKFNEWKMSFSLLSTSFHCIWIMIVTYILSRHRNLTRRNGKWTIIN